MNSKMQIDTARRTGSLLDVLKEIQKEDGYLTEDGMRKAAAVFGRPVSEIYETATFYGMLRVRKPPRHIIEICGSTCCQADGAENLSGQLKESLKLNENGLSE